MGEDYGGKDVVSLRLKATIYFFSMLLFVMIGFYLMGCSTNIPIPEPNTNLQDSEKTYRHDLIVDVNGFRYQGTGVLDTNGKYALTIHPEGKINRLSLQTCYREVIIDKPTTGWFSNGVSYTFSADADIELKEGCPLRVVAYVDKERTGFAMFVFKSTKYERELVADMKCNGVSGKTFPGVGVCQSAAGLYQQINFKTKVVQRGATVECEKMKTKDEINYEYSMAPGHCVYAFVAQERSENGKRKDFELDTIGYTDVPVR